MNRYRGEGAPHNGKSRTKLMLNRNTCQCKLPVESEVDIAVRFFDPMTSDSIPPDAIQRVLFIARSVHIYSIPPLTTTKGYSAAAWTAESNKRLIFTARLRILETAIPNADGSNESLRTEILLEDPASGELFAAAPYSHAGAVEAAIDSSRFFAVKVVGDGGKKAMLGVGFEDRSEAMDFGIALQEVRRLQGTEEKHPAGAKTEGVDHKKDFSLKAGEMIHVDLGRKARRKELQPTEWVGAGSRVSFPVGPPPPSPGLGIGDTSFLPPPPKPLQAKQERRIPPSNIPPPGTGASVGFDDGEFGEFQ